MNDFKTLLNAIDVLTLKRYSASAPRGLLRGRSVAIVMSAIRSAAATSPLTKLQKVPGSFVRASLQRMVRRLRRAIVFGRHTDLQSGGHGGTSFLTSIYLDRLYRHLVPNLRTSMEASPRCQSKALAFAIDGTRRAIGESYVCLSSCAGSYYVSSGGHRGMDVDRAHQRRVPRSESIEHLVVPLAPT